MHVIYRNTSLGGKTGQEKERPLQYVGGFAVTQYVPMPASLASALLTSVPIYLRVTLRVHEDAVGHGSVLIVSSYTWLWTYPRTSGELISNYISTKMYNVIRSFIYLFFHLPLLSLSPAANLSIKSEGGGLMTLCIIQFSAVGLLTFCSAEA